MMSELNKSLSLENLLKCLQCGSCTGSCPAARFSRCNPRLLAYHLVRRKFDDVKNDDLVWLCLICYSCNVRCPNDVDIPQLILRLREDAFLSGLKRDVLDLYLSIVDTLMEWGMLTPVLSEEIEKFKKQAGIKHGKISEQTKNELKTIFKLTSFREKLKIFRKEGSLR